MISSSKGGSAGVGFAVGALLGPLGILVAFFLGSEKEKAAREVAQGSKKRCPECAELVQPEARVCRFCGYAFDQAAFAAPAVSVPMTPTYEPLAEAPASDKDTWKMTAYIIGGVVAVVALLLAIGFTAGPANSLPEAALIEANAAALADNLEAAADEIDAVADNTLKTAQ